MTIATVAFLTEMTPERKARLQELIPPGYRMTTLASPSLADQKALVADADYIVTGGAHPITAELLDAAPKAKLVHKWGVGLDDMDAAAAKARGIRMARTTGGNAVVVAEFAIALMLAVGRTVPQGHIGMQAGKWLKGALSPRTFMLWRKTIGIVGLGNIGRALAERLQGFDVTLLYNSRTRRPEEETRLKLGYRAMPELLAEVDILALTCPLTPETRNLIDAAALRRMKKTATVINVARGGVVNEADLADALEAGTIAAAGLDVFAREPPPADLRLLHMENCVVTPHLAGACGDNAPHELAHIFRNIARVANGEEIPEADRIV